jgi:hypothetical protein
MGHIVSGLLVCRRAAKLDRDLRLKVADPKPIQAPLSCRSSKVMAGLLASASSIVRATFVSWLRRGRMTAEAKTWAAAGWLRNEFVFPSHAAIGGGARRFHRCGTSGAQQARRPLGADGFQKAYNEGRSTQVPVNPAVRVKTASPAASTIRTRTCSLSDDAQREPREVQVIFRFFGYLASAWLAGELLNS